MINGAIKKRGVSCFIGREVKGVKARKHTFIDRHFELHLHKLKIDIDDILSFGKNIAGMASMFLPFVLAESNGIHHRVRSQAAGDAIILPNIPTVCLTDEDGEVNGCVAVGTKNPLPSIIGFLDKDDKVTFVKEDESSLPIKEEKKEEDDEEHEEQEREVHEHEQEEDEHLLVT